MKLAEELAVSDQLAPNEETMKYVFALMMLALAGCASAPSEYNQGCRDGVNGVTSSRSERVTDEYCNGLDSLHRSREAREHGGKNR